MKVSMTLLAMLFTTTALAQVTDPGPRTGTSVGGSLTGIDQGFFNAAKGKFNEIEAVPDGLGPRFNLNSCGGCHIQPVAGGSSPAVNPQIAVATLLGAHNTIPSFIHQNGPIREARFVNNLDGTPDGGVHDLFVITGRSDAPGCTIKQPDFNQAIKNKNIIFRIPTPVFGLGLVEGTPDRNLQDAFEDQHKFPGISGHFNTNGNDGTITRFGWKAQNKSLLIFSGEAYNVEMGITNENFPNEREENPKCQFNALPENITDENSTPVAPIDANADIIAFAAFMRMLAPPMPAMALQPAGAAVFKAVGCIGCHIETQTTGRLSLNGQDKVSYHPFSDFAVHKMGEGLEDNITQGNAAGDEFRTAPLWGVGQRLFFLHDGRAADLVQAIEAHASPGSEANAVIDAYRHLPPAQKQALINYLRSL
jgi:CxxC motif-containing protein (DUF1111 family)